MSSNLPVLYDPDLKPDQEPVPEAGRLERGWDRLNNPSPMDRLTTRLIRCVAAAAGVTAFAVLCLNNTLLWNEVRRGFNEFLYLPGTSPLKNLTGTGPLRWGQALAEFAGDFIRLWWIFVPVLIWRVWSQTGPEISAVFAEKKRHRAAIIQANEARVATHSRAVAERERMAQQSAEDRRLQAQQRLAQAERQRQELGKYHATQRAAIETQLVEWLDVFQHRARVSHQPLRDDWPYQQTLEHMKGQKLPAHWGLLRSSIHPEITAILGSDVAWLPPDPSTNIARLS